MKTHTYITVLFAVLVFPLMAQNPPTAGRSRGRGATPTRSTLPASTNSLADYKTDLAIVASAQKDALDQARQSLTNGSATTETRTALETAVKEMERAQAALAEAAKSRDKLSAAVSAEQAAYQALLKLNSRETRMRRSNRQQQGQQQQNQNDSEMNQLDLPEEQNRYESESQAQTPQDAQQRQRSQNADRLRDLSQRQQDLNERLRDAQTALQAARTETEREEARRQLKRLQDEQRQLLSNVDEMRQQMDQNSNSSSAAQASQALDQTRSDMERAAEQMGREAPSEALASASRAQERMQNLRDDLRREASGQFGEQMRDLRTQAREMTRRQDEISRELNTLADNKSMNAPAGRQEVVQQLDRQRNSLTNLMENMQNISEQSESSEPLLSQQLYESLRQASQSRPENSLQVERQLAERDFFPQASQADRTVQTNLAQLARNVERATESVLGSEAAALRFAQQELDDLTRQLERDTANTNVGSAQAISQDAQNQSNRVDQANSQGEGNSNTNSRGQQAQSNRGSRGAQNEQQQTQNDRRGGRGQNPERQPNTQPGMANDNGGAITGTNYVNWADRLRDVEQVIDPTDLRNQLATARERAANFRRDYRRDGRAPDPQALNTQVIAPLIQVKSWLRDELARKEQSDGLVPLDRDPVPDNYAELVRKYYEKLGSAQ